MAEAKLKLRRALFHLAGLALIALVGLAAYASGSACPVTAVLSPGERIAYITAISGNPVVFDGVVAFAGTANDTFVISMRANVSNGWAVAVSPASVTFSGGAAGNRSFNVTVMVPPAASAANIGVVSVEATVQPEIEGCAPALAQGIVTPAPYWDEVAVIPMNASVELDQETRSARVEYEVSLATNVLRATKVRLLGNMLGHGQQPIEADFPEELLLDIIGAHNVSAHVWVTFHATSAEPRTYRYGLGAAVGGNETDHRQLIHLSVVELTLAPAPNNSAIITAVAVGGLASVGGAAWVWRQRRPPADKDD